MGTLTIRIDDEFENDLEQLAKSQHRTKSDLAREMLRKRVAVERFRELRRKALPLAEAAGYLSDDDVFRDISGRYSSTLMSWPAPSPHVDSVWNCSRLFFSLTNC